MAYSRGGGRWCDCPLVVVSRLNGKICVPRFLVTVRVFCLLKTASKCTRFSWMGIPLSPHLTTLDTYGAWPPPYETAKYDTVYWDGHYVSDKSDQWRHQIALNWHHSTVDGAVKKCHFVRRKDWTTNKLYGPDGQHSMWPSLQDLLVVISWPWPWSLAIRPRWLGSSWEPVLYTLQNLNFLYTAFRCWVTILEGRTECSA